LVRRSNILFDKINNHSKDIYWNYLLKNLDYCNTTDSVLPRFKIRSILADYLDWLDIFSSLTIEDDFAQTMLNQCGQLKKFSRFFKVNELMMKPETSITSKKFKFDCYRSSVTDLLIMEKESLLYSMDKRFEAMVKVYWSVYFDIDKSDKSLISYQVCKFKSLFLTPCKEYLTELNQIRERANILELIHIQPRFWLFKNIPIILESAELFFTQRSRELKLIESELDGIGKSFKCFQMNCNIEEQNLTEIEGKLRS